MKLKKFEAVTETEAMEMVKSELGQDALILNIKKMQPKGFFSFLRKATVEVTAAYNDRAGGQSLESGPGYASDMEKDKLMIEKVLHNRKISDQQVKIENLQNVINELNRQLMESKRPYQHPDKNGEKYGNPVIQSFYDAMIAQGVMAEVAEVALADALAVYAADAIDVETAAKIIYNNIIRIIGRPDAIEPQTEPGLGRVIMFMGPTGVGKTTTIAKLISNYILRDSLRVGLITADTYRIAAVEQLKTYAEILDVEIDVVYDNEQLHDSLDRMRQEYDLVCVDTGGRSHRNSQTLEELEAMLSFAGGCEKYLVLSSTTKNEDLLSIIETYAGITDFRLILTKLDETLNYGPILNICYKSGKQVEYITNGQNVPDDIELMQPEKVAKALLGLGGLG